MILSIHVVFKLYFFPIKYILKCEFKKGFNFTSMLGEDNHLFTRRAPEIKGKHSISELVKLSIGNVDQWIYIRGKNHNYPILLMLHGGPGTAQIGFMRKFQQDLEKHFVVVQWDQRGAGLSYSKHIPLESMNIEQFVHDTIEVVHCTLERLHQKKLNLVAHSWGTIIGMLAVTRATELFKRYFGIAQVSNMADNERLSYTHLLEKVRLNEKVHKDLVEIGPPPWENRKHDRIHQKYMEEFGGGITRDGKMVNKILMSLLTSKEYTLLDCFRHVKGMYFSMNCLQDEMRKVDLKEQVSEVNIPVHFLMGRHDLTTPYEPTKVFFDELNAPEKQWTWFENSAHTPSLEEPEKFLQILIDEVE